MSPVEVPSAKSPSDNFQVVSFDLDSTGRRLVDEICHIGGLYVAQDGSEKVFSNYIMPHRDPNPGARRSFGIRVVNIGRFRMLKNLENGVIIKTKSEFSVMTNFLDFLSEAKGSSDGIILVSHETGPKVIVPLLLVSLERCRLMEKFRTVVAGFANSSDLVARYGDKDKVTSGSMRSLCKTLLGDTNPNTCSAMERSKIVMKILQKVVPSGQADAPDISKVKEDLSTVQSEEEDLKSLRQILSAQSGLRPIFFKELKTTRRVVRDRALGIRKRVAETGADYNYFEELYKSKAESDDVKHILKGKLTAFEDDDLDYLVSILDRHFIGEYVESPVSNPETK